MGYLLAGFVLVARFVLILVGYCWSGFGAAYCVGFVGFEVVVWFYC